MMVLFLAAWYPNRTDAMAGLFVRKHAEAVSRFTYVCTIFVYCDKNAKRFEIKEQKTNNINEIYIYYPERSFKLPLRKLIKFFDYLHAYKIGFKRLIDSFGKPSIIHANVLTRSGAMAYILYKLYNIPYVLTEHWSRYLPQNFHYTGFIRKRISEIVVRNAKKVMPVCKNLQNAMWQNGLKCNNYQIVPNVVDDFFFEKEGKEKIKNIKRILHVSCFSKPKNIQGIINAIKNISEKRNDFELIMVGTGELFDEIKNQVKNLNLNNIVKLIGEVTPYEVKIWMENSDFFVMFSNYENAPVVISECLASGLPILSSNVGGIPEMVSSECGILINPNDEKLLTEKLNYMLDNYSNFKTKDISKEAYKYSYKNVGRTLFKIYTESIKKQ